MPAATAISCSDQAWPRSITCAGLKHICRAPGVAFRSLRTELLGFAIAGPRSRDLLATLCDDDVSNAALPFLSFCKTEVARAPAFIGRISFTGELGYEIWVPADCQRTLYAALVRAGSEFGLRHFGARALHSLRLEKSFGNWAREYRPIYSPSEAGLDRFVELGKDDFIGRAASQREREAGPKRRLVTLVIDANDADGIGDQPVWHDGQVVGWVTSGGYGRLRRQVDRARLCSGCACLNATTGLEVEILGERRSADLVSAPAP